MTNSALAAEEEEEEEGDHPAVPRGFTQPAASPGRVVPHAQNPAPSRSDLSPKRSLFLFVFLQNGFSTGKAPFQQLLHVQASRACWRLSAAVSVKQSLLLLPINNISDAQATQSHCRKGQQGSSLPRDRSPQLPRA